MKPAECVLHGAIHVYPFPAAQPPPGPPGFPSARHPPRPGGQRAGAHALAAAAAAMPLALEAPC